MLTILLSLLLVIAVVWTLAYHAVSAAIWSLVLGAGLFVLTISGAAPGLLIGLAWIAFIAFAVVANVRSLRLGLLSVPIFRIYKKVLPQMSQTEQEALEARTVWRDGDLFSGHPDWNKWLSVPKAKLTAEEQAFIDGPANELCAMVDEWKTTHRS